MGALDQVTQMKNQGVPENEIINKLQEQGVSPKAINDAMDQSKIKDAVSKPVPGEGMEPSIVEGRTQPIGNSARTQEARESVPNDEFYIPQTKPNYPRNQPPTQEYQEPANQSPPQTHNQEPATQEYQEPATQEYQEPATQEYQEPANQNYEGQEGYNQNYQEGYSDANYGGQTGYSEEYYPQESYEQDYGSYGGGTDTMIEIAEQVFAEKMRKIQRQLEDLNEFKTLTETKLNNATSRLKRIEQVMDKLQMAILEKVGSYGSSLDSIKKEMSMMQDSFSKTLPALVAKHSHAVVHKKPIIKKTVSRKKK